MAPQALGGSPTCVSFLLILSHAVLVFLGLVGCWVWGINFGYPYDLPPVPPPENLTDVTTTTPSPRDSYYSRNNMDNTPGVYKDYVHQTATFALISNDARFYLGPLCLVCLVVGSYTLLVGIFSRRLFGSTFALFSSLCLWILTLTMTLLYQNVLGWGDLPSFARSAGWVLGCHVVLLVYLPLQMLLCLLELRRQSSKEWPTINFRSVFTAEALLLSGRLALTVFTFAALIDSQILRGFSGPQDPRYEDYYMTPRIRYPVQLSLLCFAAACFNAVATLEAALSLLLGRLHRFMGSLMCLLSGVCCVSVAVLSSPAFVRLSIGPYNIYPVTMNFAVSLSVVTLSHWVACLAFPSTMRTPPRIITRVIDSIVEITSLGDVAALIRTQGMKGKEVLPEIKNDVPIKLASLIFSIISIIIVGVSAGNMPGYRMWGHILLLCANTVTLMRTLPPLLMSHYSEEKESFPVKQVLFGLAIETAATLIGGIAVCVKSYSIGIVAGVGNIFFAFFQIFVMCCLTKQLLQNQTSNKTSLLSLSEEVSPEDDQSRATEHMA